MAGIRLFIVTSLFLGAAVQAGADTLTTKAVNCSQGESINAALKTARNDKRLEVVFRGTCNEFVRIERDAVTLRGADASAVLVGLVDVVSVKGIEVRGFTIRSGPNHPRGGDFGGVNVLDGSVLVENLLIHDLPNRGIQLINSQAIIRNVTALRSLAGNYVFRSSQILFGGNIVGDGGFFGMSMVNSTATAKGVNFTFQNCQFGLIIQIDSGLEHISGKLTVADNVTGIAILAQGTFALGSFIEVRDNSLVGIMLSELSTMTPLLGAPGGGPALTVTGSPVGISVERGSTLELFRQTAIFDNGIGLRVDASILFSSEAKIHDNAERDVILSFGTKASFGEQNEIESPVACDGDVIVRGAVPCGAALAGSPSLIAPVVSSSRDQHGGAGTR